MTHTVVSLVFPPYIVVRTRIFSSDTRVGNSAVSGIRRGKFSPFSLFLFQALTISRLLFFFSSAFALVLLSYFVQRTKILNF